MVNQALQATNSNHDGGQEPHQPLDLTGLEDFFRWASEPTTDAEESRVKLAREKRIRRQVLAIVEKAHEQQISTEANFEITYLQRRSIALLTKIQELTEENALVKQMMLTQYYALQDVSSLEEKVKEIKTLSLERDAAITERRYLMDALAKLKVERDYLEDLLTSAEAENTRLASLLKDTRGELTTLQSRKWWHALMPWKKS